MEAQQLNAVLLKALDVAHDAIGALGDAGTAEVKNQRTPDISTRADLRVSEQVIEFLRASKVPAMLYTEESGQIKLGSNPRYGVTLDDIDGTENFHSGKGMLPYCTILTAFDSLEPFFRDTLLAAIMEHNSGNVWHAIRGQGSHFNGQPAKTSGKSELNRRTRVIIDHYMSANNIDRMRKIYPQAWVKDYGASGFHMAGVASGAFDAYINWEQKAHELGAGFLLVKEAQGYVADLEGSPLDNRPYDFDAKYPVIAASTPELGKKLLALLQ